MGIKYSVKNISNFSAENSCRFDYKFIDDYNFTNNGFYTYKDLFDFVDVDNKILLAEDKPFEYVEIGCVNKIGDVSPHKLSYENRDELNEPLFKKIEKGDIIKPQLDDILISKIRPYLNKIVLINDDSHYFTKAFIQIRPKVNSKLLYYCLRSVFLNKINSVSRQGKGYPTLKENDIKTIQFSSKIIDNLEVNKDLILSEIEPLENEISILKGKRINTKVLLDKVFSNSFKIDLESIKEIDDINKINVPIHLITSRNINFRNSYRWFKIQSLQKQLYKEINCIKKLGNHIISTKNGWSPSSQEGGDGTPILGQEHFNYDSHLNINANKTTQETRNKIEDFYIKKGDFFVSRGNTIDLVALASIVEEEVEDDILFPDLYIKMIFDDEINDKYLAYLFNSFLGRYYFKYVSKGKNQTMVKISSTELDNFYLPIPDKKKQLTIVNKIKKQIDAQKEIDKRIAEKQAEISAIIEKAIQTE